MVAFAKLLAALLVLLASGAVFAIDGEVTIGSGSDNSANLLKIYFVDKDGSALANQQVFVSFNNTDNAIITSSEGSIVFISDVPEEVNVSVSKYDHVYRSSYFANGTMLETFSLYPLLAISGFDKVPSDPNCYLLFANISDPRANVSNTVLLTAQGSTENGQIALSLGENGSVESDEICVRSATTVRLIASNQYDQVNASVLLPFNANAAQGGAGGFHFPTQPAPAQEGEVDNALLSVIALALVVGLIALFLYVRSHLQMVGRFLIEYIRLLMRVMNKRKPPKVQ